jgi:hypothetical protein
LVTVTGTWEIQYLDGDNNLVDLLFFDEPEITDDLNSDMLASFSIPNTPNNRVLVSSDRTVAVFYNNYLQFSGLLRAADVGGKKIKCYVYDVVFCALDDAEPITGVYDAVPANQIMTDVCTGISVNYNVCPTTEVTLVLYKANRLDVVKFLADALGLDYYPSEGQFINLGFRNSATWSLQPSQFTVSKRALDRTKFAGKVIIRGIDLFGRHVTGEAGSGVPVRVFNEDTPANQDALMNLAAKKLAELNTDSAGAPISTRIDVGFEFEVGDSLNVSSNRYLLFGTRRIVQMVKTKTKVNMQLDFVRKSIDKTVADLRSWEKKGIYLPGCTSWSISLQGLVGLYHVNEGSGTVAHDSSPRDSPQDGVIVNGSWEDYAGMKILTFNGATYIDLGNSISFSPTNAFSVGGWVSPSILDETERNFVYKQDQFALGYVNDILQFKFIDDTLTTYTYQSDAGKVKAYGRHFVMMTYDGSLLKMYLNAQLHKTWTLNLTLAPTAFHVFLGTALQGVLGEMMFWTRHLADQEVTELYFFPLNRVV